MDIRKKGNHTNERRKGRKTIIVANIAVRRRTIITHYERKAITRNIAAEPRS
jgi:hypothetical protein